MSKLIEFFKKYETYIIFFPLILAGILIWKYYEIPGFTGEWASCVDYIKDGILYQGQPKCYHGPVNFLISYYLIEFFPNDLLKIYELIVLISSLLLFFLIYKIIKNLNLKPYYLLLTILFFTLIYISPINNNSGDSVYSTLFMLYGFYILFFSRNLYYKYLFSSFLFTIAIFTRLNVLIPILLILIYYFITNFFSVKDKKLSIAYLDVIKASILILIIPLITILVLRAIFPNIIAYSILTQLIVEQFSWIIKLKEFFSGISLLTKLTFLIMVLLIPIYWFYKKKDIFSFVTLFGFILITYGTLRGHHDYFQRYYLPIFPFLIITIIFILNNIRLKYKKILFILIILIFSLSALKISDPYFTSLEFKELRNIVDGGFKFIPPLQGRILADNDYFLRFNKDIDPKKVDIVVNKIGVDGSAAIRFETLGLTNPEWKKWQEAKIVTGSQLNEMFNISKKIINDEYSIIVVGAFGGPSGISSPIIQILGFYSQHTFNKSLGGLTFSDFEIYCEINFPSLMNPCKGCAFKQKIFFTNITTEDCSNIANNLWIYYNSHLTEICNLDQGIIVQVFDFHNFKCNSNKHLLEKLEKREIATLKEALLILAIIFLILLYYYLRIGGNNENTSNTTGV